MMIMIFLIMNLFDDDDIDYDDIDDGFDDDDGPITNLKAVE